MFCLIGGIRVIVGLLFCLVCVLGIYWIVNIGLLDEIKLVFEIFVL